MSVAMYLLLSVLHYIVHLPQQCNVVAVHFQHVLVCFYIFYNDYSLFRSV